MRYGNFAELKRNRLGRPDLATVKWRAEAAEATVSTARGSNGQPQAPALGAPRGTRGAPRYDDLQCLAQDPALDAAHALVLGVAGRRGRRG